MNGICKIADAVYAMEKAIKERLGLKMRKPKKKGDFKKRTKKLQEQIENSKVNEMLKGQTK